MAAPPSTRATLLTRIRDSRDEASWREFDERYRDVVLRYCRRRGLQQCDAEDVRQILMMRLARSLREFRYRPELGRFRDYLHACTRNAIHAHFSRQNGHAKVLSVDDAALAGLEAPARELDEVWEAEWRGHHLRQAMEKAHKSFERRSLDVFDRLVAGDRPEGVATSLGMTTPAVYKVKQRMKDFLRERIAEQLADEEFPERR